MKTKTTPGFDAAKKLKSRGFVKATGSAGQAGSWERIFDLGAGTLRMTVAKQTLDVTKSEPELARVVASLGFDGGRMSVKPPQNYEPVYRDTVAKLDAIRALVERE